MVSRVRQVAAHGREEALMAAYARGDDGALEALFNLMAPRILAFLRCCLTDAERGSAEELLQATFVELRRRRRAFRRGMAVRPFLFELAARVHRESQREAPRSAEPIAVRRASTPPSAASSKAERGGDANELARQAIAALQGSQRVIIQLHRFEGLSFAEIAGVMGASETTIRAQACGVYQQLRERLQPLLNEGDEP
jgi:RNA polymerase sigma-70 factor (ECF subfamily)